MAIFIQKLDKSNKSDSLGTIEWRCDKYDSDHCKVTAKTKNWYHPVIKTNYHNHISNPEWLEVFKALYETKSLLLKTELKARSIII